MKLIYFVLLFLALPSVFATSIAISPALIEINSQQTNNSFILMNSNSKDVNFSIKSTSNGIILEETTGLLKANSNKKVNFQTQNMKQNSYLIISFESENSIQPALTLKLKKNETAEQAIIPENHEAEIPETNKPNPIEKLQKNNDLIYIVLAVFVLLLIPLFSMHHNKKYRIGRIGQRLRIFIKRLS